MKPILRLAALLTGLLSANASLAYDTGDAGGSGGAEFREMCASGSVLTQVKYDSGKDLNKVAPVCATLQNGQILDGPQLMRSYGTNAEDVGTVNTFGENMPPPTCYGNTAVSAIHVRVSRHGTIHTFALTCRDVATGAENDSVMSSTRGGEGFERQSVSCNGGDIAIGLRGHYGALIDSLGLICAPIGGPAPKQSSKTNGGKKKPPAQTPTPGKPAAVDNSGQGGEEARANTDTTIYDSRGGSDVGYLADGDRVAIVQCRNDWCEISEPMEGWVWGPDLDR